MYRIVVVITLQYVTFFLTRTVPIAHIYTYISVYRYLTTEYVYVMDFKYLFVSIQVVVPVLRALYGVHAVYICQTILWHNYISIAIYFIILIVSYILNVATYI